MRKWRNKAWLSPFPTLLGSLLKRTCALGSSSVPISSSSPVSASELFIGDADPVWVFQGDRGGWLTGPRTKMGVSGARKPAPHSPPRPAQPSPAPSPIPRPAPPPAPIFVPPYRGA